MDRDVIAQAWKNDQNRKFSTREHCGRIISSDRSIAKWNWNEVKHDIHPQSPPVEFHSLWLRFSYLPLNTIANRIKFPSVWLIYILRRLKLMNVESSQGRRLWNGNKKERNRLRGFHEFDCIVNAVIIHFVLQPCQFIILFDLIKSNIIVITCEVTNRNTTPLIE